MSERPSDSFLIKVNSSSCLGGSAKVVRGGVRPAAHGPHAAQDGYEFSPTQNCNFNLFLLSFIYLFIFREGSREGEREGVKYQCVVASHVAPTGNLALNPGMCPNWELN